MNYFKWNLIVGQMQKIQKILNGGGSREVSKSEIQNCENEWVHEKKNIFAIFCWNAWNLSNFNCLTSLQILANELFTLNEI